MGGKTSTSTNQVSIPPEVLARYNSVNATAENVAQTPFQQYSTNPNSFVAPITPTQSAGIQNTNAAAGMAQPYFQTGTGFALAGAQPVNAQPLDTSSYMNPYLNTVLGSTAAMINQNNQQAMSGQTGNAMQQGYFGGDRSGIASAVLQGQQNLAAGQVYSGIASDAYNQALQAAMQQQGVGLGAAQANRAALQQTGQSLAELGTGAQGAAISGAQAQLGAGQVEQQTEQAGKTALYNQFLQQQSYPFQTAQFLANIAEGTGALSGSTTTSTTPGGMFMSDERLKEDMRPIGKGFDGANIYRFRYKDDPENVTRIGFSAQEMERQHPEAVHDVGGFKAVDQTAATDEAARRGFAMAANDDGPPRQARQVGGMSQWGAYPSGVNPMSVAELLQAQAQMYGPYTQGGLYGGASSGAPYGGVQGHVPPANLPVPQMLMPHPAAMPSQGSALHAAAQLGQDLSGVRDDVHDVHQGYDSVSGFLQDQRLSHVAPRDDPSEDVAATQVGGGYQGASAADDAATQAGGGYGRAYGGFARAHRQFGGGEPGDPNNDDPYKPQGPGLNIPTAESQHPKLATAAPPSAGGGGGGLGSAIGMGSDLVNIAKFALPFFGVPVKTGGRVGYAAGGEPLDIDSDLAGDDPLLANMLRPLDDTPAPGKPAGGPGPADAPSAGFAGAAPPGAPAAAAAPGFAGSGARPRPSADDDDTLDDNDLHRASGTTQFFQSKGWSPAAAAGITANLYAESGISANPRGPNDAGKAYGVFQAHDAYQRSFQEHMGKPMQGSSLKDQEEFLHWDLTEGPDKAVGARMSAAKTPEEASRIFMLGIERPKDQGAGAVAGRQAIARQIAAGKRARGGFAGARHGYQTDGFVDPDATVDPSAGQDDSDRRGLPAAPQVDPAIIDQAKQAASDPNVRALAQQNRVDAQAGDPSAPPAAQAAVAAPASNVGAQAAAGLGDAAQTGFIGARNAAPDASQRQPDDDDRYLSRSEADTLRSRQFLARKMAEQQGPQGGGLWGMLQRNWIPLAQGFAAMEAAPTRNPLVAISQGIGGFATGEQAQRAYQMDQDQKLAEIAAAQENIEGGAYGQRTQRIGQMTGLLGPSMAQYSSYFTPLGFDMAHKTNMYLDQRPGSPTRGMALTEGQVAQEKQGQYFNLLTRADPSGKMRQMFGIPGTAGEVTPPGQAAIAPPGRAAAPGDSSNGIPVAPGAVLPGGAGAGVGSVSDGRSATDGRGPPTAASADTGNVGGQGTFVPLGQNVPLAQRLQHGDLLQAAQQPQQPRTDDLDPETDPLFLRRRSAAEANANPEQSRKDAENADSYMSGQQPSLLADGKTPDPTNRWVQYNNDVAASQKATADGEALFKAHNDDASAFFSESGLPLQSQIVNGLIDVYKHNDLEGLSPQLATLIGKARTNPWLRSVMGPNLAKYEAAVQVGDKENARLAGMSIVTGLSQAMLDSAPAAGLGHGNVVVPDVTKEPAAKYKLIGQLAGLMGWQRARWNDWNYWKGKVGPTRVADYDAGWTQENPISKFERGAYEKIPFFDGMKGEDLIPFARHPKTPAAAHALPHGTPFYPPGVPETRANLRWN